jgi:phosphatidylserine decarboxylase precursor
MPVSTSSSPGPLKEGARPLANADFICPVDGAISQFGAIERDRSSRPRAMLFDDRPGWRRCERWRRVSRTAFATLYLSPKDYHRIHMPCAGKLTRMIHVPGELFSVNPVTARGVPGLFARNERVVCVFEGEQGPSSWCWSAPPSSAAWRRCGMASSTRRAPAGSGTGDMKGRTCATAGR